MRNKVLKMEDTFGDSFALDIDTHRLAITIDRKSNGSTPNILCLHHDDTLALRDALLEQFPLPVAEPVCAAPVLTPVGEVAEFTPPPQGININIANLTINA